MRMRLIPARAGKTVVRRARREVSGAHPRAGGENRVDTLTDGALSGSSPRGRGKLGSDSMSMGVDRLIPARAGKTTAKGI